MNYSDLYRKCKQAINKNLLAKWCPKVDADTYPNQEKYRQQIADILENEILAPEYSMPLLQYMEAYLNTSDQEAIDAKQLVTAHYQNNDIDLWSKIDNDPSHTPYIHQKQSWESLLNGRSIVVTTGTGSGKTECFMLPIVKDILENDNKRGYVQAIFMYPLNALMEDQKSRLFQLLKGTPVRFAVYNSNLPDDDAELRKKLLKVVHSVKNHLSAPTGEDFYLAIVNSLLGIMKSDIELSAERLDQLNVIDKHIDYESSAFLNRLISFFRTDYPNLEITRQEMRDTPPEILITNPSMVEYMLLRDEDNRIFEGKALRWFVIDETHTFVGAAAVEMAMQIKRLLLAFEVKNSDVRFATSSATLTDPSDPNADTILKEFIGGIIGKKISDIDAIAGEHKTLSTNEIDPEIKRIRELFEANEYVRLDEVITTGTTVEEKLHSLDNICKKAETLRIKLHLFFRVLDHGLKVCLTDFDSNNDVLKVYADVPENIDQEKTPFLELKRCSHCGEYFVIAQTDIHHEKLYALERQESDLFDAHTSENKSPVIIALNNNIDLTRGTNGSFNEFFDIDSNSNQIHKGSESSKFVLNIKGKCPHCLTDLNKKDQIQDDDNLESYDENPVKVQSFRLYPSDINKMINPVILSEVDIDDDIDDDYKSCPHQGQQLLSFVDSRKEAARSTLEQNMYIEELYLYKFIKDYLQDAAPDPKEIQKLNQDKEYYESQLGATNLSETIRENHNKELKRINTQLASLNCVSWSKIAEALCDDPKINILYKHFISARDLAKLSKVNDTNDLSKLEKELKLRYVYAIMIEYLGRQHITGKSPETMGLFHVVYPKINGISKLPDSVENFNDSITDASKKINLKDWKNLLTIFMNMRARSNDSLFVKLEAADYKIDIFKCQRFESSKSSRRPISSKDSMKVNLNASKYDHVTYLLASLLNTTQDNSYAGWNTVVKSWMTLT